VERARRRLKSIEVMSEVSIGRVGVYLVCASLETMGVSASIVEQEGFDVVAVYKGQVIRIEVKATSNAIGDIQRYAFMTAKGGKKRKIDDSHCDLVALVDNVGRRCYYMPAKDVKRLKTSLYDHNFTDEFLLFTNAVKKLNEENEDELG
jgi:hypothetical protein